MFLPFPLSWVRPKANGWQAGPRFSPRDQMPSSGARNLSVNAMATLLRYSRTRGSPLREESNDCHYD
jgi:hypothetical protein